NVAVISLRSSLLCRSSITGTESKLYNKILAKLSQSVKLRQEQLSWSTKFKTDNVSCSSSQVLVLQSVTKNLVYRTDKHENVAGIELFAKSAPTNRDLNQNRSTENCFDPKFALEYYLFLFCVL